PGPRGAAVRARPRPRPAHRGRAAGRAPEGRHPRRLRPQPRLRGAQVSALRESFVLPLAFLTVAGAGGLRLAPAGGALSFVPPPLITLVLAVLLMGAMVRAGLLVPAALFGDERTGLENLSGVVVVLTLFLASAQLFTCLTPDAGVLRLVFNLFF